MNKLIIVMFFFSCFSFGQKIFLDKNSTKDKAVIKVVFDEVYKLKIHNSSGKVIFNKSFKGIQLFEILKEEEDLNYLYFDMDKIKGVINIYIEEPENEIINLEKMSII